MVSGLLNSVDTRPVNFSNGLLRPSAEVEFKAGLSEPSVRIDAPIDEALGGLAQYLEASSDKVVHALEGLRKDTLGEKSFTKGTLGALRKPEALDLYLAQGCGTLTVEVCPGLTDKELYHGLKRAYGNMLHALLAR